MTQNAEMYADRVKSKYNKLNQTGISKWNRLRETLDTLANEIIPRKTR